MRAEEVEGEEGGVRVTVRMGEVVAWWGGGERD